MKRIKYLVIVSTVLMLVALRLPDKDKYFEIIKNLDIFATLYKEINTYYVDEISPTELMETGIEAMLASLDPYTNYISEDYIETYRISTTGEYAGIGAVVANRNGVSTILLPYEGFSADRAGLKIGDVISRINGVDIGGMTDEETGQLLKGQTNSTVQLTIQRPDGSTPFDVDLSREKIVLKNVPYFGMINDDIGYIQLTDFTSRAGAEVESALLNLKNDGAKKIILDLRGNLGGLLIEAVNICNVFIPQGKEVVHTRGKIEEWTEIYRSLNLATDTEIPLAVLVNSRSASAAEIVSGVMQDYDRGVLIGRRTFGKGLVQRTHPLAYNSQLKVTTAKYYIPSGRCIQAIDYSLRKEDGSIGEIPDSLKQAFQTANGRVVFDGGGVYPDVEVAEKDHAEITLALLKEGLLFDYANVYYYQHASIVKPKDFRLTKEAYDAFKQWLSNRTFSYETQLEKQLKKLEEVAQKDQAVSQFQSEINQLRKAIKQTKSRDLEAYKTEITGLLEQEIALRFYLQRGLIESTFDKDPDILKAIDILDDTATYQSILSGS